MKHKLLSILLCLAMALSLLPTAALAEGTTVTTSEQLVAAIANAQDGDTITLGEGEFTTYGKASPKKSLTFVGAGTGTVWTIGDLTKDVDNEGNGDYSFDGCDTITFKDMTLKVDNKNYRGFIRINHTIVDNCVMEGRTAYWGYETATFQNGTTFNAPEGDYALWDYSSKSMTFDGCTFNISGKGVNVYVESGNASNEAKTVEVNSVTVNSTAANKAFLNIKNSTQAYEVEITGNNTVSGLNADTTTGSNLYQVETTTVTETSGKPVKIQEKAADGTLTTVYEVKAPAVAKVGGEEFTSLTEAFAVLNSNNYTLELLVDNAWDAAKPVYWKAGDQSEYAATLAAALTAAYKAGPSDGIIIVCRPGADVGEMTHGHVADNLTIYGNNAYLSGGECDLEVDTYPYSRTSGTQIKAENAQLTDYLSKDITITAYELDNLGVWGERHTNYNVNIILTDCDGKAIAGKENVQRVYISGTTGENNIKLTDCDFLTAKTAVYSNADGDVTIDHCSFTGSAAPVNINHKAGGTQQVHIKDSKFINCGDEGDWKQFAAPVRFVNSGSGTMSANVSDCTITGTKGANGDILLGDGRTGQKSNNLELTVSGTNANVQAQQPGYYNGENTDDTKKGSKNVAASDTFTSSVENMISAGMADYVMVGGVKGFETTKFATFEAAYAAIKPELEKLCVSDALGQGVADTSKFDELFTDCNEKKDATLTYTIVGNVVYDETNLSNLLTIGRSSSHYSNGRHLINFKFVGGSNDKNKDTLTVNSNITLPYEWWGEKTTTSISFENLTITGSAPSGLYPSQPYFESIDFTVNNCTLKGIKIYNCSNVGGSYTITNSTLDGTDAPTNAYAIHLQGHESAPLTINISGNKISGYDRGINIDQATANATISGNTISVKDTNRSCIQLTKLAETTITGNTLNLTGGNALTFHEGLAENSKISFTGNTVNGTGYLIYDNTNTKIDLTYSGNTIASTVDTTKGVYNGQTKNLTQDVNTVINPAPSYSGSSSSDPTYSVSTPSKTENGTVTVSPKSASKGSTVTITVKPDSGYVLGSLTVTDSKGNELKLTDKGNGKYTFTMPSGRVEVKASFTKEVETSPFADVATDAYYYEAVKWAVSKGITDGVGNNLFAPGQPCTRAQIVTFLWRAAGSPEPKGTAAGMTDVLSGSYYEKAVAWAIENGVTTGTTATTFSPDATCTRAQAVTFLARALNAKASGAAEFSDVPTDSYFAEAVAWAASNGVTEGVGNGLFAPDNDCTRGQIVTFLYRAYNK